MSEGRFVEDKRGKQTLNFDTGESYSCQGYVGETRVGYMCSVDFCDELGEHIINRKTNVPEGTKIYDSLKELKQAQKCTDECGYTKVILIALEVSKGSF